MQSDFIPISKLIVQLEEAYPNELPTDPQVSLEDIRLMQGQQLVVNFIKALGEDGDKDEP